MTATVETTHSHGSSELQGVSLKYSDGTSCFVWVPTSISPELLEDLLNDALSEK